MCSIPGLPTPGSNVTVHITRVNSNPLCVLVELWGNFEHDRKLAYQRMRREIQFPRETFRESEGNPGDLCLVQVYETWYRARVVSRHESKYSVFLIDEGRTLSATISTLAWGPNDFFHLPPEVEFCVLANVLPLSPENRWSPMALEFLKSLCGKTVDGCVQDVLVPHRTFLIDIPCISKQMYEMGFSKKMSIEKFKLFFARSLQSLSGTVSSTDPQPNSSMRNEPVETNESEKRQCFLYPELQTDTVETVIVTEVTHPLRIFCQLKVFSLELKKLTEQITYHYEGRLGTGEAKHENLGSPCAARGSDGKWYRSVLQQVLASSSVVEVLHVDYGKKDFVQVENIRPLADEFFRMPVVTYVCSLYGIMDKGVGWMAAQIDHLKSLLLHRTVIAKFEYQSLSEGVHHVTLFGDENVNINKLFGLKENCLLETEKLHGDCAVQKRLVSTVPQESSEGDPQRRSSVSNSVLEEIQQMVLKQTLPINSSHMAVVQYVNNPSEFWIQTQRYAAEFDLLMHDICDLYDNLTSTEGLVSCLTVGLFCAARSQDGAFYRAIVCDVIGKQVKVYFMDYGNMEIVEWYNIRVLPEKYQELPALALKCTLAGIRPKDGEWSQSATVFFSKAVENKILNMQVSAKSPDKYIVQLTDASLYGEKNISKMMCVAGLAETDDITKPMSSLDKRPLVLPTVQAPSGKCDTEKVKSSGALASIPTVLETRSAFKEHLFPIGSSVEVNVSYIARPNDFWCQVAQNAGSLKLLMQDIQNYYANSMCELPVEAACVARHPDSGMWYRALIIQKHASPHVDVLFIDYGQMEKVSLQDLRPISPTFLKLKGQAFRCSLYNLIHPVGGSSLEWSAAAVLQFQDFVDSAASSYVSLKCTIYAVMYDSQKVVYNVVDLETPFQSICSLLVQKGLANRAPPKKAPLPPFRLDTYYYSTHNVKTGGEDKMHVTYVKSVNQFYCQLGRNSDTIEELTKKVNYLCRQLKSIDCPQTFGTVCFAKYIDGRWYRGHIKSTHPTFRVHFVDYGDTLELEKSDLLPIPIEASEIMSVPVQAIECGLSDIPADVSGEVNSWFEKNATDRCFTALVVAKEPGGKLIVELYDGKMQVNSKIKGKFAIQTLKKNFISFEGHDVKARNTQDLPIGLKGRDESKLKKSFEDENGYGKCAQEFQNGETVLKRKQDNKYSSGGIRLEPAATIEKSPNQQNVTQSELKRSKATAEMGGNAVHHGKEKILPKLSDLPVKSLKVGLVSEVFVSHCYSPSSFFLQLTQDEDQIYSIVDKLNGEQSANVHVVVNKLQEGDLVNAVFPDDGSRYRAVVRNKSGNEAVDVEFIDFGNTASVSPLDISRLEGEFLELPRLSIHCSLSGVLLNEGYEWDLEEVENFKRATGGNGDKKLACKFMRQVGSVWEVTLEDQGAVVRPDSKPTPTKELNFEEDVPVVYKKPDISEGDVLEVYASSVVGPHYFWCQYANSCELQKISKAAEGVGNSTEQNSVWADALCPGSLCLALFPEDERWYRGEVITKIDKVLSILFVDYGNESEVDQIEVRSVPHLLLEAPPQAFLCRLEGFDLSQGVWDNHAADKFFELLTDEVLKVTVTKVEHFVDYKTPPYCVRVECKGKDINDIMSHYWKWSIADVDGELSTYSEQRSDREASYQTSDYVQFCGQEASELFLVQSEKKDLSNQDDSVSQCCEKQNATIESLNLSVKSSVMPGQQQDASVKILLAEGGLIKEVAADLEYTTGDKRGFDEQDLEYPTSVPHTGDGDHPTSEKNEALENQAVTERSAFLKDRSEHSADMASSLDGVNLIGMADVICESNKQPSYPPDISTGEGGILSVSEGEHDAELLCEAEVSTVGNTDFPSEMPEKDNFETENYTVVHLKTLEEDDKGRPSEEWTTPVGFDEIAPMLNTVGVTYGDLVAFFEDQSCDEQAVSDIYQDVFQKSSELLVEDTCPTFTDDNFREKCEVDYQGSRTQFCRMKTAEGKLPLGSDCIVWSYGNKTWCKGKIVKISDDCAKVLLLEHDEEIMVDQENIFVKVSEDPAQELAPDNDVLHSDGGYQQAYSDISTDEGQATEGSECAVASVEPLGMSREPDGKTEEAETLPEALVDKTVMAETFKASTCSPVEGSLSVSVESEKDSNKLTSSPSVLSSPKVTPEKTVVGITLNANRCGSAEACLEEQVSKVMHLTLKIEEMSDDDVIFVKETRMSLQQVTELSEKDQPDKDMD